MGDVQLVAHGQAPHFAPDAGGHALPPQLPHTPRCTPVPPGDRTEGQGSHRAIYIATVIPLHCLRRSF